MTSSCSATPLLSLNFCKPTLRGIGRTEPELSWHAERMLSRHYDIGYPESPAFLIYGDAGKGEHRDYAASTIRIFVTGENVKADWNEADYALTHERVYSERHWRIPLHRHWYDTTCTVPERNFDVIRSRVTRFCSFVYSNERAKERVEFFDLLNAYKPVDSGGGVRNTLGYRVKDKLEFISQSKFTIAFENESSDGYSTEKIIQPLLKGSIPIYWGDPSIDLDFNPDCFINVHRFPSFEAAAAEVARIDADDEAWSRMASAPIFPGGKIPEALSDEAIMAWFRTVFDKRKAYVPRSSKLVQRLGYKIRAKRTG